MPPRNKAREKNVSIVRSQPNAIFLQISCWIIRNIRQNQQIFKLGLIESIQRLIYLSLCRLRSSEHLYILLDYP